MFMFREIVPLLSRKRFEKKKTKENEIQICRLVPIYSSAIGCNSSTFVSLSRYNKSALTDACVTLHGHSSFTHNFNLQIIKQSRPIYVYCVKIKEMYVVVRMCLSYPWTRILTFRTDIQRCTIRCHS